MKKKKEQTNVNRTYIDPMIQTDPQGSYTGKPANPGETPVQDADDL